MDRPGGFRHATIFSATCNLGGCILRLFARSDSDASIALLHASYIVNALGGPGTRPVPPTTPKTPNKSSVAISAPALLANAWFPANERGLATGIAVACNTFGLVFSYLLGPLVVTSPDQGSMTTYMSAPPPQRLSMFFSSQRVATTYHDFFTRLRACAGTYAPRPPPSTSSASSSTSPQRRISRPASAQQVPLLLKTTP